MAGEPPAVSSARPRLFTPAFLRLCALSFITFFGAFQLFPTIPFRIIELGGSELQAGLFLAVYTWISALSAPWMGALADRFGRRRLLLVASGGFIVFSLLYGVIETLPTLLGVAAVHGVLWSGLLSASGALITDVIPLSRRTEGIAYWGMAPTAAIAVAPAIGLAVYRLGWRALTIEIAAVSGVVALLAWSLDDDRNRSGASFPKGPLVDWRVIVVSLTIFVLAFGYGGVTTYVALMAIERGIEPPSLFFTVFASVVILSRIVIAPRADRIGPTRLLFPAVVLIPPGLLLLAIAKSRLGIVGSAALFGAGFGSAYPAFMAWLLGRTAVDRRGATFGSVLFCMDIAIGTGSLAAGWMAQRWGYSVAFGAGAAVAATCAPIFLLTRRLLPAQLPEAEPGA